MASKGDIEAGKAYVQLFLKNDMASQLTRALKSAGKSLHKFGRSAMVAGSAVVGPLVMAAQKFASFGDDLHKMSARTGVAIESLSELKFAAEQSGASVEDLAAVMTKLNRRFGRVTAGAGTANQISALEELGLSVKELESLDTEGRFLAIANAMAEYGDRAAAAGLAQRVFGTGVDKLLPLIWEGRSGIKKLREEAQKFGLSMSGEDANAAAAYTDAMNRMSKAIEAAWMKVGAAVAPTLMDLADKVSQYAIKAQAWISENKDVIVTALKVAGSLLVVGAGLVTLGTVLNSTAAIVTTLTVAVSFLAANPLVLLAGAAIAAGLAIAALTSYTAKLSDATTVALEKADQQRAAERARMDQLAKLAEKQSLNSDEMATANTIIDELTSQYGDMGLSINETTGAIEGMTVAQRNLNEAQREAARLEIKADIATETANVQEMMKAMSADAILTWPTELGILPWFDSELEGLDRQEKQIQIKLMRIDALIQRSKALASGDTNAITGGATPAAGGATDWAGVGDGSDSNETDALAMEKRLIDQLADYRIAQIEDEQQRAIAAINKRYDAELARAKELGADEDLVTAARIAATEGVNKDFAARRAEDAQQQKELRAGATQRIQDQTTRLQIEQEVTDERQRQRMLIEQERKIALRDRGEDGPSTEAINELYDTKVQGLRPTATTAASAVQKGVALTATYSAAAARISGYQAGGGPEKKMADGIVEVAKNTKEAAQLMQTFLAGWRVA